MIFLGLALVTAGIFVLGLVGLASFLAKFDAQADAISDLTDALLDRDIATADESKSLERTLMQLGATIGSLRETVVVNNVAAERPDTGLPIKRVVVINVAGSKGETSMVGILEDVYDDAYVLTHAKTMPELGPIVGSVIVPRNQVGVSIWFQADVPDGYIQEA